MRRSTYFLLSALTLCAFTLSNAQTTVTTVPVGFNTATVPAAPSSSSPSSTVVSVPFYQVADFQGAISSVDSSSAVSISGAGFTTNQFTTTPHLARFKTGNSTGRFFIITANTATQLTLDTATAGYTLTTGAPNSTQTQVAVGNSVEIVPANTLSSLFPSGAPFQVGASANAADNVLLFNGTSWETYFYNNSVNQWRRSGSGLNQNTKVILPDQGLFIVRRATSALNLTFLGTVPSTTEKTDIPGPGSSFKANRFPVDVTLKGSTNPLNLQNLPGWLAGASANAADNVLLWNGTSWSTYFYNGTNWRRSGSGLVQDSTVIPLGAAMFIVRQSSATGSNSTFTQTVPYSL